MNFTMITISLFDHREIRAMATAPEKTLETQFYEHISITYFDTVYAGSSHAPK